MEVDEYGRVQGEAHTSGALDFGAAASLLSSEASASSLFTLQQLLQRDDCGAIGEALSTFAFRVLRREAAAVRGRGRRGSRRHRRSEKSSGRSASAAGRPTTPRPWAASAPSARCCRASTRPRLGPSGSPARDWGPHPKCLRRRRTSRSATRRSTSSRPASSTSGRRRRASPCAGSTTRTRPGPPSARASAVGGETRGLLAHGRGHGGGGGESERKGASTRQLCVRLCAGVLKFGDSEAREAACREGGVARTVVSGLGDDPRGFRRPGLGGPAKPGTSRARSHRSRFG